MTAAWLFAAAAAQAAAVPHPYVACWTGSRSWTAAGEAPSNFVLYDTDAEPLAVTIEHRREHLFDGGRMSQDYN